jgi:hypothetical protein
VAVTTLAGIGCRKLARLADSLCVSAASCRRREDIGRLLLTFFARGPRPLVSERNAAIGAASNLARGRAIGRWKRFLSSSGRQVLKAIQPPTRIPQRFSCARRKWLAPSQEVHPAGLEPTTYSSGGCRSIQLSYGCVEARFAQSEIRIKRSELDFGRFRGWIWGL